MGIDGLSEHWMALSDSWAWWLPGAAIKSSALLIVVWLSLRLAGKLSAVVVDVGEASEGGHALPTGAHGQSGTVRMPGRVVTLPTSFETTTVYAPASAQATG